MFLGFVTTFYEFDNHDKPVRSGKFMLLNVRDKPNITEETHFTATLVSYLSMLQSIELTRFTNNNTGAT